MNAYLLIYGNWPLELNRAKKIGLLYQSELLLINIYFKCIL